MRIVYEVFDDGGHTVYQTDDDGNNRRHVGGEEPALPPKVRRMSTYIEVSCDDQEQAVSRARKALREIAREYLKVPAAHRSAS